MFSRKCGELEAKPPPPSPSEATRGLVVSATGAKEHRSYAMASIMETAAFLDTTINELYESAGHEDLQVGGALPPAKRAQLIALDEKSRRNLGLLSKYDRALHELGEKPFDHSARPYLDVQTMVYFRNSLVHSVPRWRDAGDDARNSASESDVAIRMSGRGFTDHPFLGAGTPVFPNLFISHAGTTWCWRAAADFVIEFFARVGVAPVADVSAFVP